MSFKSLLAPIYLCLVRREIVVPQGDVDIKRCPSKNDLNCDFCVSCGPTMHARLYSPCTTATCRKGFPQSPPRFPLRKTLKHTRAPLQGAGHGPAGAASRSRGSSHGCDAQPSPQEPQPWAGAWLSLLTHKKRIDKKSSSCQTRCLQGTSKASASRSKSDAQSHGRH